LGNRRCCNRTRGEADAAHFQEITTFHILLPLCFARPRGDGLVPSSLVFPMAGAGLLFCNVGPETKALGFSISNSRLYGPEGRMTNW
jgi:hypothetical protein